MREINNTTTLVSGEENISIRLSAESPAWQLKYSPPKEGLRDGPATRINHLEEELGRSLLALNERDEEIVKLQTQISYYESQQINDKASVNPQQSTAPVLHIVKPTIEIVDKVTPNLPDKSRDAESILSPSQKRYESIILFLLKQPNFTLESSSCGKVITEALQLQGKDWNNAQNYLARIGLIELQKSNPTRVKSISLNVNRLTAKFYKFISGDVINNLKAVLEEKPNTEESAQPQVESLVTNGQPKRQLSARVRRQLTMEVVEGPKYRDTGKDAAKLKAGPKPFLEHRHLTSGAKRH